MHYEQRRSRVDMEHGQAGSHLSTAEAEYVAISEAAKEALYLHKILAEFKQTSEKPAVLFEDNSAAAIWTKNETCRSDQFRVPWNYVRFPLAPYQGRGQYSIRHTKRAASACP